MPSYTTYHLTWFSHTLGLGYLFTAAPAKCSHCSLPWMRGISSPLPFLTFNVGWLLYTLLRLHSHHSMDLGLLLPAPTPGLGRHPWPWTQGDSSRPPPLTSDVGFLLPAASPGLGRHPLTLDAR